MNFKIIEPHKLPEIISEEKNFKIASFADTHIGGMTSYLPSNCRDQRNELILQTSVQSLMETNLMQSLDKIGKVDIVEFLGDMVEGRNKAEGGLDVSNINADIQVEWGVKFGQDIIDKLRPSIFIGICGSNYHVENSLDYRIIRQLALLNHDIMFYYGFPSAKFWLGDKLWFLNHQGAEGVSKAGTLEKYYTTMLKKSYGREQTPNVIGYAHIHQAQNPFQINNAPNPTFGFFCPCMKMPDLFCSKGPTGTHWDIGFLYMEQEGTNLWGKYINTLEYWKLKQ